MGIPPKIAKEIEKGLDHIMAIAGNPDAAEGCRLVIQKSIELKSMVEKVRGEYPVTLSSVFKEIEKQSPVKLVLVNSESMLMYGGGESSLKVLEYLVEENCGPSRLRANRLPFTGAEEVYVITREKL